MEVKSIKRIIASSMIVVTSFFIGCGKEEEKTPNVKKFDISDGAVIVQEGSELKNYDYKAGKYRAINEAEKLANYNSKSGSYIYIEDGKHYASNGVDKVLVDSSDFYDLTLSPDGRYISYFTVENEEYKLVIKDIEKDKTVEINTNVTISGKLVQWVDNGVIAYYGISETGENGIFTYEIKSKDEKLIHKINSGFIEQLICVDNVIYFIENDFDSKKLVKALRVDGEFNELFKTNDKIIGKLLVRNGDAYFILSDKNEKVLSCVTKEGEFKTIARGLEDFKDIVKYEGKYIILGKMLGDNNSVYIADGNKVNRVVYGFPKKVMLNKGFVPVEDGVLFIGSVEGEDIGNGVYKVDGSGTISSIYTGKGDIEFIRFY